MRRFTPFLLWSLLLVACNSTAEPAVPTKSAATLIDPTATPENPRPETATELPPPTTQPTVAATETAVPATATVAATATPEEVAAAVIETGRTEDGAFFIGAVDAPVTMIDYSDFL